MIFADSGPSFDQIIKAIETVGFPVVIAVLILLLVVTPLFLLARTILSGVGKQAETLSGQVGGAVTLFSGTLAGMGTRQEQAFDALASAINRLNETQSETNKLLVGMGKSQDITLRFITENMVQLAKHRQIVEPESPDSLLTGIIKPVEGGQAVEPGC